MSKKKGSKADALIGDAMVPVEPVLQKASFPGIIVSAKNEGQKQAIKVIETHEVSFLYGVPGTGKSHLAIGLALKEMFNRKYERIILTRPYVEAGEHLGFLPGGYNNKIAPFMYPVVEIMSQYVKDKNIITKFIDSGNISVVPFAYMRGCTFKNSFIVADECQNSTVSQMRMLLTRIGDNSKLVVTGDVEQSDIGYRNGLSDAIERLREIEEIGFHEMGEESCVRSGIVGKIEKKYRNK